MNKIDRRKLLPRAVDELSTASYAGVFIYFVLFTTILYATGYHAAHPRLAGACLLIMFSGMLARLLLTLKRKAITPEYWIRWFSLTTLLMVCAWSSFWTYAVYADGITDVTIIAIIASVGITSAGIITLAPLLRLSLVTLIVMFWPAGLVMSTEQAGAGTAYAMMLLAGSLFLAFVSFRLHRQFWATLNNAALLEERATQLAEATRAKSDFLARMSHEIRTPLNGILGMAHLLERTQLDTRQKKYTGIVRQSGEVLLNIVNDILDLSRIEANKLQLVDKPFNITALVNGTLDLFDNEATSRGLEIVRDIGMDIPRYLVGDAGRLRQVLTNLVGNAIKYTEDGQIRVSLSATPAHDHQTLITISVEDTGIGIPASAQADVFEAFTRVDGRQQDGSGLGLAIVKQLVNMMGGNIQLLENDVGKGSVFTLQLPFAIASPNTQADAAVSPVDHSHRNNRFSGKSILVAEDNSVNRDYARELLKSLGCRVTTVSDGQAAVKVYGREHYDAVLMDIQMPVMDGLAATRVIRTTYKNGTSTPIIAVTANALKGEHDRCLAAGLDDYISKPYSIQDLQAVLGRWVDDSNQAGEDMASHPR